VSLECPVGNLMVNGWGWTSFLGGTKNYIHQILKGIASIAGTR